MAESTLSPFVYWGQTSDMVTLKIALSHTEDEEVTLTEESLSFKANGVGVKGNNLYSVNLNFYLPIDPENSRYRRTETCVEFQVRKTATEIWPRLTEERVKLPWLKIDFDKFMVEGESEDEANNRQEEFNKDMLDKITMELGDKGPSSPKGSGFKLNYMVFYNLFQFIGFCYIVFSLLYKYITQGNEAKHTAFDAVGTQIMICQLAAFLEVVHPMLGLVRTGIVAPLAQVLGRNFILFLLILQDPRLQERPIVFYLFLVWGTVELVRYPYYMLQSAGLDIPVITWMRYTAWIPLYPLGLLLEGTVVFMSTPLFVETGFFSFALPNTANMAFYFPYLLAVYPLVLAGAGYFLMRHMYQQRRKKVGPGFFGPLLSSKKTR
ncbi:very-long-chain (3R)-3-hydroxyacyl-CoA dehydratase 3-like [Littorina saxatilis]|uniref:Very-long-chain (3R)-3-hydroxyacyl-CoA dehydratase n=1 Tax=Littorina saxatilis TaxID=31220 RepID=A0AAN9C3X6_9CAEN